VTLVCTHLRALGRDPELPPLPRSLSGASEISARPAGCRRGPRSLDRGGCRRRCATSPEAVRSRLRRRGAARPPTFGELAALARPGGSDRTGRSRPFRRSNGVGGSQRLRRGRARTGARTQTQPVGMPARGGSQGGPSNCRRTTTSGPVEITYRYPNRRRRELLGLLRPVRGRPPHAAAPTARRSALSAPSAARPARRWARSRSTSSSGSPSRAGALRWRTHRKVLRGPGRLAGPGRP